MAYQRFVPSRSTPCALSRVHRRFVEANVIVRPPKESSNTMPFGIGLPEVIVLLIIVLVVFGLIVAALRLGTRH